tara:strand:+ start:356 stop:928 length:573 start_codon:yes stop_codon:yes gene_type:complete
MNKLELIEQYKNLHRQKSDYGSGGDVFHAQELEAILEPSAKILDFGCGKGDMVQHLKSKGFDCKGYDPAIEKFQQFPDGDFDAVICLDVMEHIREEDIDSVFDQIKSTKAKYIVLNICHVSAINVLPDGRNCHETVKPMLWWQDRMKKSFTLYNLRQAKQHSQLSSRWMLCRFDVEQYRPIDQEDSQPSQ